VKRETREWLEKCVRNRMAMFNVRIDEEAQDALDSERRLKAEVRRLRAAESIWERMWSARFSDTEDEMMFPTALARELDAALRPAKPERKR